MPSSAARLLVIALVVMGGGCEELGNPSAGVGSRLRDEVAVTITWVRTGSPEDAALLARRVPEGRLHHADRTAPAGGAVALVMVEATLSSPGPEVRRVTTSFLLRDGQRLQRSWAVPSSEARWYGLFALPEPPLRAVTRVYSR